MKRADTKACIYHMLKAIPILSTSWRAVAIVYGVKLAVSVESDASGQRRGALLPFACKRESASGAGHCLCIVCLFPGLSDITLSSYQAGRAGCFFLVHSHSDGLQHPTVSIWPCSAHTSPSISVTSSSFSPTSQLSEGPLQDWHQRIHKTKWHTTGCSAVARFIPHKESAFARKRHRKMEMKTIPISLPINTTDGLLISSRPSNHFRVATVFCE